MARGRVPCVLIVAFCVARPAHAQIGAGTVLGRVIDQASSVFDASILTGPVANFPVADSFNRKLERDYSNGDVPHVFRAPR